jgi:argonaute-like protein implicated in RNA metabolism and viral defense
VTYNDRVANNVVQQGRAVLAAAEAHCRLPGYAVVMLHRQDNGGRDEDRLAGLVTRELRSRFDITAAVIHSQVGRECYEQVSVRHGQTDYRIRADRERVMNGYLRVVALNKVLLTNERWPFVLANPLHADVTIGIDVKQNTAGLTIVSGGGARVSTICRPSRQREMLLTEQVRTYLMELLRLPGVTAPPRHVVLHRDGRVWPSERAGARQAIAELSDEGVLAPDATLTILEVSKSAPAPLRLFEVTGSASRTWVENPQVGTYLVAGSNDAYLCATGRPFRHPGTVNPLHVRYVEGGLPFARALEDLYALTTLAWTRPDDCTREPITIKLNDRRLGEDATEYDADALSFAPGHEGGDVA